MKLHLGLVILLAVSLLGGWANVWAADKTKWRGYLVDRNCAESVKEDSNPESFLEHHTKDCALMPNCRAKGYVIYSDHQWLSLDKRGNGLAVSLLRASKRKSGFYVEVSGARKGDAVKVQSIKEINEPKAEQKQE